MLQFVWDLVSDGTQAVADAFVSLFNYVCGLVGGLATTILQGIIDLLPASWQESIKDIPFESLQSFFGPLNWFIPIYTILGMYAGTFAVVATIRFARWLWSIIEGISILGTKV